MPIPRLNTLGAIAVSVAVLVTFIVALGIAFFLKNDTMLNVLVGTAAANATTAVGFWLGSSASSQKKDDTIANHLQASSDASVPTPSPG